MQNASNADAERQAVARNAHGQLQMARVHCEWDAQFQLRAWASYVVESGASALLVATGLANVGPWLLGTGLVNVSPWNHALLCDPQNAVGSNYFVVSCAVNGLVNGLCVVHVHFVERDG